MEEIHLELESAEEIRKLLDPNLNFIFLHKFNPSEALRWWKTDLKAKNEVLFKDLDVRQMVFDTQTNLEGLQKFLDLKTNQLRIYQFDKPVSNTLQLENLPEGSRDKILKENGLHHFFFMNYEFLVIRSYDPVFIDSIASHPEFQNRVTWKNRNTTK